MRGGPVRGVEPAAEPGWARQQQLKDAWKTRGRRFMSAFRSGQQPRGIGGKTAVGELSADSAQVCALCPGTTLYAYVFSLV